MQVGNGEVTVPPGFRFHPTDEELLYYYLRKKVSYQPIDLDVIREVDLNRLEPWDLREKCRIGTGPQNDWYFFSHKDRKYPTGTRTNRATAAGFWKATGRDKAICLTAGKRIGMRKTLVFYIGRAPHGHKTDWIMHEYRLHDHDPAHLHQEDGWVVCRVFKKKNQTTGYQPPVDVQEEDHTINHLMPIAKQSFQEQSFYSYPSLEGLPHLSSPDSTFLSPMSLNIGPNLTQQDSNHQKLTGDWLFLDKLLTNYQTLEHQSQQVPLQINLLDMDSSTNHKFPFQYLGSQP